ncbi:MAG TPA: bifunctional diaminohydroxyphosphoribosylaminopyrimidine deaminase/5-amino-6-(5-phosphoribosylamino)uracil reductase RibD [Gemmatimonadaceae bacterium]|nr:bifunctional diaminohydroxyphosphoribosylaminopyrimidine deaminase/5-amino-6-(5-phosphoribosylamino)uracil reductase RibD [Gemmatimonadaceae bacterium]
MAHMRRALTLAREGWGQTAPNPMVGAVVVAGGVVVGEAYHARYGEAHAEAQALREAGERARGATLYVTLEPCAHFGKTPPCADAVIAAGISRVVIASPDPSLVARGGASRLRRAGVTVEIGLLRDEAMELNAAFFNALSSRRPWITLKLALSADGAIADPSGAHRWITGPDARAEVHRLRANADAIAVGVNTVIADDPLLTARDVRSPRRAPLRVVFDSTLRTPRTSALMRTAREVETILIGRLSAVPVDRLAMAEETGATVLLAPSLHESLEMLRARDIRSLFVEGGARIAGSLLREDLVDRLVIFRSSLELGCDAPRAFAHAPEGFESSLAERPVIARAQFGDDVMTTYALHEVPCSRG